LAIFGKYLGRETSPIPLATGFLYSQSGLALDRLIVKNQPPRTLRIEVQRPKRTCTKGGTAALLVRMDIGPPISQLSEMGLHGSRLASYGEYMRRKKNKKEPRNSTHASVKKEMAKPRMAKSARTTELNPDTARIQKQPS